MPGTTAENKMHEEKIKKENKYLKMKKNPEFVPPRGKIDAGSDKPSSLDPTAVYRELHQLKKEKDEYEQKLKSGEIKLPEPSDLTRFVYKSTSSYGKNWEEGIERRKHTAKWTKPKGMCDITRYADNYHKMSGKSPHYR